MDISYRPAEPGDLDALHAMHLTREGERGLPTTATTDDTRREWFDSTSFDAGTMSRVAVAPDGALVGYAGFEPWHEQLHGEGWVMPAWRGHGIGTALTRWLVASARERDGISSVWSYAPGERPEAHALLQAEGFTHARSFFNMVHRAPAEIAEPAWPEGITLRTFEGEEACAKAAEGWNATFIDHWNFHPETAADYTDRLKHPDEDTSLWVFAYEGDTFAGFCLTSIRKGDELTRGGLGPIGTARTHRGIGLGRALLRNGVRALAARGADEVRLGVDSENLSGAVRLYASEGFGRDLEGRAYRFDL